MYVCLYCRAFRYFFALKFKVFPSNLLHFYRDYHLVCTYFRIPRALIFNNYNSILGERRIYPTSYFQQNLSKKYNLTTYTIQEGNLANYFRQLEKNLQCKIYQLFKLTASQIIFFTQLLLKKWLASNSFSFLLNLKR